jgi:hypothetical protein
MRSCKSIWWRLLTKSVGVSGTTAKYLYLCKGAVGGHPASTNENIKVEIYCSCNVLLNKQKDVERALSFWNNNYLSSPTYIPKKYSISRCVHI